MAGRCLLRMIAAVLVIGTLALASPGRADTQTGKRVALVIGNGAYTSIPRLPNPTNDARLMAQALKASGFILVGGGAQTDLNREKFVNAIQQFGQAVATADVALFYYSGHGLQINGTNYLVPTSANPTSIKDLDFQMVSADLVMNQMSGSNTKLNIVILDACRNNPFPRSIRAAGAGLAEMKVPEGTLISYATQPGNVAMDGEGKDSPFTLALTNAMREPGTEMLKLFNHVGLSVKKATGGQQQPWVAASPIDGDFYFIPPGPNQPTAGKSDSAAPTLPAVAEHVLPANPLASTAKSATVAPVAPSKPGAPVIMRLTSAALAQQTTQATTTPAATTPVATTPAPDNTAAASSSDAPAEAAPEAPKPPPVDPLAEALKAHHLPDSAPGDGFRCPKEGYVTIQGGRKYEWHGADSNREYVCLVSIWGQDRRMAMMFYDMSSYDFNDSMADSLYSMLDISGYGDSVQVDVPLNSSDINNIESDRWRKVRQTSIQIAGHEIVTDLLEIYTVHRGRVRGIWHVWHEPHSGLLLKGTFELLEGLREYAPSDWTVTQITLK